MLRVVGDTLTQKHFSECRITETNDSHIAPRGAAGRSVDVIQTLSDERVQKPTAGRVQTYERNRTRFFLQHPASMKNKDGQTLLMKRCCSVQPSIKKEKVTGRKA